MKRRLAPRKKSKKGNQGLHRFLIILLLCAGLLIFKNIFIKGTIKGLHVSPYLSSEGTTFIAEGKSYSFAGFNIFQIATLPGHNVGCGSYISDIDGLFSTLPANSVIRMWAWQGSMAINPKTGKLDWSGIDRALTTARLYRQKVILSLGNQSGQCDDGQWKGSNWYQSGFKNVYNPSGLTPLSYWDYVQQIVNRYKSSTVVSMWEPINEPETSDCSGYTGSACYGHQMCPDHVKAAATLRQFFDTVGGKIKSIDPNHLVESGLIGTGQCGSDNDYYTSLHQSPGIDVASYHDYNDNDSQMPGDQWNGLAMRLRQMKSIGKPLIVGELGMLASQAGNGCLTFETRASKTQAKMDAMFANGVSGILLWNRTTGADAACNYDISNTDPLVNVINSYKFPQ